MLSYKVIRKVGLMSSHISFSELLVHNLRRDWTGSDGGKGGVEVGRRVCINIWPGAGDNRASQLF